MNIIKPPVRDPSSFLQRHIHRDLEQLAKTLGRSADEATTTVHLMLCSLLRGQRRLSSWSEHMGCCGGAGAGLTEPEPDKGSWETGVEERTEGWLALAFPLRVKT